MLNGIFEVPEDYVENGDGTGRAVYKNANRVRAQFETIYELNQNRTLEEGREVFDQKTVVLIQAKGDSNVVSHLVTDQHKRMFPSQWRKYEQGQTGEIGHSLANLYGITPNLVAAFSARGIFSIKNLAEADDSLISDIPDADRARALAQVWLSSRDGESEQASLIVEATSYKARAEEAEAELVALRKQLEESKKPSAAKRRTRTKKATTDEK